MLRGKIEYETVDALTSPAPGERQVRGRGLALHDLGRNRSIPTVPTGRGGDPRHAAPMRLDYALGSGALLEGCPEATAITLTDGGAGALSDHFPVVASLCQAGCELPAEEDSGAEETRRANGRWDRRASGAPALPGAGSAARAWGLPAGTGAADTRGAATSPAASPVASAVTSRAGRGRAANASAGCADGGDYAPLFDAQHAAACAELSGVAQAVLAKRAGAMSASGGEIGAEGSAEGSGVGAAVSLPSLRLLRSCAVVGSSGLLRLAPRGAAIDRFVRRPRSERVPLAAAPAPPPPPLPPPRPRARAAACPIDVERSHTRVQDAVFRLNRAPTTGYEVEVGRRTDVRLVNLPQSRAWAAHVKSTRRLPPEVASGEHLLLMASHARWSPVAPALVTVQPLNKTFRTRGRNGDRTHASPPRDPPVRPCARRLRATPRTGATLASPPRRANVTTSASVHIRGWRRLRRPLLLRGRASRAPQSAAQ